MILNLSHKSWAIVSPWQSCPVAVRQPHQNLVLSKQHIPPTVITFDDQFLCLSSPLQTDVYRENPFLLCLRDIMFARLMSNKNVHALEHDVLIRRTKHFALIKRLSVCKAKFRKQINVYLKLLLQLH